MNDPLINISRKQAYIFAAFLVLYEFLTYLANDMILPGMIEVVRDLNGEKSAVATSMTAFVMGGASLQIFLGPLSDRYGRRPVMIFGACLFLLTTLIILCSQTMTQFITFRFFQGMGLCFITVIGYASIQEMFAEIDAIRLIAVMANVSVLAPLLGPLLGSVIIHYFSWRIIFVIIGCLTVLALWGLWKYMPELIGQTKRDGEVIHATPLSMKVVCRNYKLLFKNKTFLLGTIAEGFLSIPCLVWIALAPVILIMDSHLSVIQYGLWQIPVFGAVVMGNFLLRELTNRYDIKNILWFGSYVSLTGIMLMVLLPIIMGPYYLWIMPGLIIYFFSLGIAGGTLERKVLFSTDVSKGTTSALMKIISMIIMCIGIEGGNLVYHWHSTLLLSIYCAICMIIYFVLLRWAFFANAHHEVANMVTP